ncbi:hypothetical protein IQ260_17465 [Leptolyngbya cf. ectocarpi LEGE 11479]|uniref:Uncharacterized protein n=1 Tax=Leptolyngbya cf. ectocarpi LEGE 11479 TaxID=1828722 RepID=A0A928ZVY7_LEPEC|nr:hypothetical protein [Leptolyngbya ectocarpi]MBE9068444.1 hypothetical protein [Leptolyngbya cf. ectocarpi LEGE 11479]
MEKTTVLSMDAVYQLSRILITDLDKPLNLLMVIQYGALIALFSTLSNIWPLTEAFYLNLSD